MSQILDEQLSAVLDGELPDDQYDLLLRRMDADPELREKFARYGLIGDAITSSRLEAGALALADRVREELVGIEPLESATGRQSMVGSPAIGGMLGAGVAAAAALVLALNLSPQATEEPAPHVAGGTPLPVTAVVAPDQSGALERRANVSQERMTRYLVAHSGYANPASRQFVDSHIVMPVFQRAMWPTSGLRR